MSQQFSYKIQKSKRRSLALQITPAGELIVKTPLHLPERLIDKFLNEHEDWIKEKLEKIKKRPKTPSHTYANGDIFLFLGQEVKLQVGDFKEISVSNGSLFFPIGLLFRIQKEIENFYIREARQLITSQTEKFAKEMGTSFREITFSDTRSQWGRCTVDNRLQFSWRLIMAPLLTLNYVVIHELAHTAEKNHSRAFWSTVRKYTPSYKQQIKWLHDNGTRLII